MVAEATRLTTLRDEWLIKRGKPSPATKLRMKQAAEREKKEIAKQYILEFKSYNSSSANGTDSTGKTEGKNYR